MVDVNPQIKYLFEKVKNKYKKFNTITSTKKATGHSLAVGNPGYGKTTCDRKEVELRRDQQKHKILCVYDAGRMDMALFMFPSNAPFWKKPKYDKGKIIGPKAYKTELLYPNTKHVPDKLPKNGKLFTIPVKDLNEEDISALTGSSSFESIKDILNSMENDLKDYTTPTDYLNTLSNKLKKSQDQDGIKVSHYGAKSMKGKVFQPLINEGILSSSNASTALDLREILKDKETITTLVLRHCPQKLWGFLVNYFMNHSYKILSGSEGNERLKQNTTIVLNEIQDLMEQESDMGESVLAISRSLSKIFRQSRSANLFILGDTQLPQKLPDVKDIIKRMYIFNSGFSVINSSCETMGLTRSTGMLGTDEMSLIPNLPPAWYFLIDREKGVSFHKMAWLRSRTYEEGDDFYSIYENFFGRGSYYSVKKQKEELKEEERKAKELWETKKNNKKIDNIDYQMARRLADSE